MKLFALLKMRKNPLLSQHGTQVLSEKCFCFFYRLQFFFHCGPVQMQLERPLKKKGEAEESERGREKVFFSLLIVNNFPGRLETLPSTFTQHSAIDGHNCPLFLSLEETAGPQQ